MRCTGTPRCGTGRTSSTRSGSPAPGRRAARRGYLPFGAGPRMCIGREFALVEGVLMLSALAGRFRLERLPAQVVRPDPSVTIRPRGGLPLRLRHRELSAPRLPPAA